MLCDPFREKANNVKRICICLNRRYIEKKIYTNSIHMTNVWCMFHVHFGYVYCVCEWVSEWESFTEIMDDMAAYRIESTSSSIFVMQFMPYICNIVRGVYIWRRERFSVDRESQLFKLQRCVASDGWPRYIDLFIFTILHCYADALCCGRCRRSYSKGLYSICVASCCPFSIDV